MKHGALTLTAQERRDEREREEKNDDAHEHGERGARHVELGGALCASESAPGAPWRKPGRLLK